MKRCSSCGIVKELLKFSKNRRMKDNRQTCCKNCSNIMIGIYRKTKAGIVTVIYAHQKCSSKHRNHPIPTYSKQELKDWLFSQPKFHVLYDNWKRLDYQKMYAPSVDRKDDSIGYTMSNIQLMTWGENNAKAYADMRSGRLTVDMNPQKQVSQFTKDGEFVDEFVSMSEASLQTGAGPDGISRCCLGKLKTSGGFRWKLSNKKEKSSKNININLTN